MPALEARVKTALDETRLSVLGAQVLFGFHLNGAFQNALDELGVSHATLHVMRWRRSPIRFRSPTGRANAIARTTCRESTHSRACAHCSNISRRPPSGSLWALIARTTNSTTISTVAHPRSEQCHRVRQRRQARQTASECFQTRPQAVESADAPLDRLRRRHAIRHSAGTYSRHSGGRRFDRPLRGRRLARKGQPRDLPRSRAFLESIKSSAESRAALAEAF